MCTSWSAPQPQACGQALYGRDWELRTRLRAPRLGSHVETQASTGPLDHGLAVQDLVQDLAQRNPVLHLSTAHATASSTLALSVCQHPPVVPCDTTGKSHSDHIPRAQDTHAHMRVKPDTKGALRDSCESLDLRHT